MIMDTSKKIANANPIEYKSYRENIKSGDLLIWSSPAEKSLSGLILRIIRFFTFSEYAHVGIAIYIGNRLCVIEAVVSKIQLVPVSSKEEFYHIPMNISWDKDKETFLLNKLGLSYSIKEAIKAYLNIDLQEDDDWQCAELANRFYRSSGLEFGKNYTPSSLVKSILSNDYTIKLIKQEL